MSSTDLAFPLRAISKARSKIAMALRYHYHPVRQTVFTTETNVTAKRSLLCLTYVHAFMANEPLRAAYDAGLKSGLEKGFPSACPFAVHDAMDQRFAWLSGFSVGKIVRTKKATSL